MLAEDHPVIANANALLAAMHGGGAFLMVAGSLWHRELAFSPLAPDNNQSFTIPQATLAGATAGDRISSRVGSRLVSMRRQTVQVYAKLWGRRGLLGVNGNSFHVILIARELLETVLQTVQAYRMSWYLPRMLLNRFYLSLLVMNCWSSVFIYSLLFKRNEARKRFACLVFDCILDLVSCISVPLIVVLSYVGDYDSQLTGFPLIFWYDDVWSARVLNEFQMVLIVSWSDLMSRVVFSIGLIATTTSLKELLRKVPGVSKNRIDTAAVRFRISVQPKQDICPILPCIELPKLVKVGTGTYANTGLHSRGSQRLLHLVHIVFGIWGVAVLGLHIQASIQPELPQCALQVHPWATQNPACYLAVLDCHRLGITGKKKEVEARWREFDRSTVVTLAIRHCPALEVPDSIGDFHLTTGIKVYNSTIKEWGASAAVTNTNHPALIWLYFVRVHLPDGRLPEGIMSTDFPGNLYDLEFTHTNVREVPDDLDTKWLIGTTVYFEYSELTNIPPVILRLDPYSISFIGSPITELPPEVFEVPGMVYLYMGSIAIQGLPYNVANLSPDLAYIYLTDTNVSFFWPWIDPLVERSLDMDRSSLLMGGSAYCAELEKITSGEVATFSALASSEYSKLMDASEANRGVILHTVDCDLENAEPVYPIDFEDRVSALQ
ncbi:Centrosomal protein of 41 kDa [Phytophthora pseudosyringae]|uniref:Centrosomal protein of 41 kDa n=1 Tax=Phytophthora pseudosyringae TaxID=221518 RepID=A0A8T1VRR5_9STRA|nr:Centrosomal protein of 41 kDa [Phytophthora pseudosyringae]